MTSSGEPGQKPVALEQRGEGVDGRRYSPSTARNREPVRDVFAAEGLTRGRVLEIASGTGEHGAFLTEAFEGLDWTYSDIDPPSRASQAAWRAAAGHDRLHGPLTIDASSEDWGEAEMAGWDVIVSMNMIHIAPFAAGAGLVRGAGRLLAPGGRLFLYGPYARDGVIAPSNAAFSESLKSRDPDWGVRDLDREIVPLALQAGLSLVSVVEMPANNLSVIFRRA
ncbi:MAG: DUF938 domain-containing protein [Hyphomonas sp.]|nr:DUF938 domain-containing protein [Hyphomonas sp.]